MFYKNVGLQILNIPQYFIVFVTQMTHVKSCFITKDKEEQESSVCSEKPIYEAIECSARVTDATKEYTPLDGNNKSAVEVKDESKVKGINHSIVLADFSI